MLRKIWDFFIGCFRQVDLVLLALCMLADYFGGGGTAGETVAVVVCAGLFFLMAGGIALALAQRWKEIERGEEDEARKY